jgi:16S rRNA (cytidine1402-2'-O)-methyltransferase
VPLLVAATPIGNPADATGRLKDALASVDVVAAEDTRRVRRLAAALGIRIAGRVVSYYDAVERARTDSLLTDLRSGSTVLLLSDAGTPLVSDPGHRLVTAAVAEGIPVHALPGPSAVLAALAVAGLPVDRWCFEGFLPRKAGERRARLSELAPDPRATVFFEAPHRLTATLTDLAASYGADRAACVCRELTKTHEEVRRAPLGELVAWAGHGVRGEITIVVAGAPRPVSRASAGDLYAEVAGLVADGMTRRDAVDAVAAEHGISRREVYAAANNL